MAINIFSGNAQKAPSRVNSASASSRAQAAKQALGGNAVASDSGTTAVKAGGVLGKIGNTIGEIAGVASKFLPGAYGAVASGLANVLNDPEWWQSVPGEQITLNTPLTIVNAGTDGTSSGRTILSMRPAIAEFATDGGNDPTHVIEVFTPNTKMVTQYLMPEIRKVVNAVPLQSADAYNAVLRSHASIYAIWRTLKKFDYILKHGQTYLPNLNVSKFPVFQVDNASWLQSTINRLEEYLRANVRIPHTLCEYMAWRYGRVYKATDSAKSGLVLYNAYAMDSPIASWNRRIANLMAVPTSNEEYQKANADLYNAYFDHDLMVEIRDDTQFRYDPKEFALRTNCDVRDSGRNDQVIPIYLDSNLDNATAFMASSVSTRARGEDNVPGTLFPVEYLNIYTYSARQLNFLNGTAMFVEGWNKNSLYEATLYNTSEDSDTVAVLWFSLLKTSDIYNKNIYMPFKFAGASDYDVIDVTALAYDMALTTDTVVSNEHVFAFANLINIGRKRSMSYQQAEKVVATDLANTIEKLDVATVATPK